MKTSARNQFSGTVKTIRHDMPNSEVTLLLSNGSELTASITRRSCEELKLAEGGTAIALIKAGHIIIATDLNYIKLSARNQLHGVIAGIERGAVNSVVTLDLGGGILITAAVTMQSAEELDLRPGQKATALFKAGNVILGVLG